METVDDKVMISDIFFNIVYQTALATENGSDSRTFVSYMAGIFSKSLADCGIDIAPAVLREDYFSRL